MPQVRSPFTDSPAAHLRRGLSRAWLCRALGRAHLRRGFCRVPLRRGFSEQGLRRWLAVAAIALALATTPAALLLGPGAELALDPLAERGDTAVHDFRPYVDGEALTVAQEPASGRSREAHPQVSSWYTFTVSFAPGQERRVTNTYRVTNTQNSVGDVFVRYILTTGSYWKGEIGQATVTLHLGKVGPDQLTRLYPNNWRFAHDGRTLVWERRNFEPAHDLLVAFSLRAADDAFLATLEPSERDRILSRRSQFHRLVQDAPGPEAVKALYEEAVAAGDPILAAYLRSLLPETAVPRRPPAITGLKAQPGSDGSTVQVEVDWADPDADLVAWRVRLTPAGTAKPDAAEQASEEQGLWDPRFSGRLLALLPVQTDRLYAIRVNLEDAQGHSSSRTIWYDSNTGQATDTDPRARYARWLPVGAAVVVLGLLAVSRARRRRHQNR